MSVPITISVSGRESNSHQQSHENNLASAKLTPREVQVAKLLAEGFMVQNVASILEMKSHTAETHTRSIYAKLGVASRSELTLRAIQYGIIDCPCQNHQTLRRAA